MCLRNINFLLIFILFLSTQGCYEIMKEDANGVVPVYYSTVKLKVFPAKKPILMEDSNFVYFAYRDIYYIKMYADGSHANTPVPHDIKYVCNTDSQLFAVTHKEYNQYVFYTIDKENCFIVDSFSIGLPCNNIRRCLNLENRFFLGTEEGLIVVDVEEGEVETFDFPLIDYMLQYDQMILLVSSEEFGLFSINENKIILTSTNTTDGTCFVKGEGTKVIFFKNDSYKLCITDLYSLLYGRIETVSVFDSIKVNDIEVKGDSVLLTTDRLTFWLVCLPDREPAIWEMIGQGGRWVILDRGFVHLILKDSRKACDFIFQTERLR